MPKARGSYRKGWGDGRSGSGAWEAKERLQREAEAAARAVQERVEQRRAEEVATGKKKRGRKPKVVESTSYRRGEG